jgi:hypothetical protein
MEKQPTGSEIGHGLLVEVLADTFHQRLLVLIQIGRLYELNVGRSRWDRLSYWRLRYDRDHRLFHHGRSPRVAAGAGQAERVHCRPER